MAPQHLSDSKVLKVWPDLAPGETTSSNGYPTEDTSGGIVRFTDVTSPQLFFYGFGEGLARPTVMVCPGGGYHILASDLEGSEIAEWLNTLGFASAVLHYRVPGKRNEALADAQRAISLLRFKAKDLGIDPERLGMLGFSAGGHLTARTAAVGDHRSYSAIDEADRFSCAPNFSLLIYPAYLGDESSSEAPDDVKPNHKMGPIFLAQTEDDTHYCTTAYAKHLAAAGVSFENNIYDKGGHGYGLRLSRDISASAWPTDAAVWLRKIIG